MYPQARIFIRTALAYLVAAFLVGGLVLVNQGLALDSRIGALLPVFYHLLMVGWTTQLICGVALWMFPPFSREQPRGDERLGWATYALLNSGLLLRVVAEPLHALAASTMVGLGAGRIRRAASGLHVDLRCRNLAARQRAWRRAGEEVSG